MSSLDNVTSIVLSPAGVNYSKINTSQNVTIYGSCEQNGTPTPSNPLPIVCNNGIIKARHQSGLPLGYTLLAYIESTGTQAILTDYMPLGDDTIEVDYTLTSLSQGGDKFIIGSRPSTSAENVGFWVETYGSANSWYVRYGSESSVSAAFQSGDATGTFSVTKNVFKINGTQRLTPSYNGDPVYPMSIFARRNRDNTVWAGAYVQISNVRVYGSDNTLKHNYVPAKRSDNAIGMYDTILGQFFMNQGTGDFTAGSSISDPIEIYTDGTVETVNDAYIHQYTVEDYLLSVDSTYRDEQVLVLNTTTPYLQVNRKVGVKVLDGTENGWSKTDNSFSNSTIFADKKIEKSTLFCSHFKYDTGTTSTILDYCVGCASTSTDVYFRNDALSTVGDWTQYLAAQYAAGTPVIVIYALATPTTETKGDMSTFKATSWLLPITVEGSLTNLQISYSTSTATYSSVFNNKDNITSVNLRNVPWENNSMYNAFYGCDSLLSVSNINNSVTNMSEAFSHCHALTTLPVLPSTVTNIGGIFYQCYNLRITNDLIIPSNVTSMILAFCDACRGLTQIRDIIIPNSVTNMKQAFQYFAGTTNASGITARTVDIGTGVTNMNSTFDGCILSATTFRIRSTGVTDATNCFRNTTGYNRPNGTLYVRVPANSTTYNSFVAAGYSTTVAKDQVLLVTY